MIEYVLMTQDHVKQIGKLEKENFSMPWSENAVFSELKNPLSLWIVAVEGNKVAGYVGSQSVLGEADMMNLAVDASFRRRGIGKELVCRLVDKLREKSVSSLTLEVRASNGAAISLYESVGFLQVGRRPNYYSGPKEDALILRKEWDV